MSRTRRTFPSKGFTLIELMLSVAMVLFLIIGINFVFQKTTDAIGAGLALNNASRDSQGIGAVLTDDFNHIDRNPPCFIIASQFVTQYLNYADAQTSTDPTFIALDTKGTQERILSTGSPGTPTAPIISPAILNYRNHRTDIVRFFAHGTFQRRTANDGSFTSSTTSQDAFITLGHALLPTTDGNSYIGPVTDSLLNQYYLVQNATNGIWAPLTVSTSGPHQRIGAYASDWVLARSAILLKDASTMGTEINYPHQAAAPSPYIANMTPLGYYSPDSLATPSSVNQSSRYDLAAVTPAQFLRNMADTSLQFRAAGYTGAQLWWNPLIYSLALQQTNATQPYTPTAGLDASYFATAAGVATPPVYSVGISAGGVVPPLSDPNGNAVAPDLARPACNPQIQTPLTSASVAQLSPYLLQHCSQFIVEYAGDYLQQNTDGTLNGVGPDGQIDFVADNSVPPNHRIRWYGMPRSTNGGIPNKYLAGQGPPGTYTIRGDSGTDNPQDAPTMQQFVDVIPLRDYYTMWFNHANNDHLIYQPSWEVEVNFIPPGATGDYANPTPAANMFILNNTPSAPPPPLPMGGAQDNAQYACAWYNDMPAMIRILIKVDDPNDKLKDGPWYEYIFRLK